MNKPYQFFEQLLEIIHYEGDRTAMTQQFFEACKVQAVDHILKRLPEATQEEIKQKIEADPKSGADIAKTYISEYALESELEIVIPEFFKKYLTAINPGLTPEEKSELKTYLAKEVKDQQI